MKFLLDAQLPIQLARWLRAAGFDVVHTADLALSNRTTDREIARQADAELRVLVTKDADFVDSHLIRNEPARLLLISVGNTSNLTLKLILERKLPEIQACFEEGVFVEVGRETVMIRG